MAWDDTQSSSTAVSATEWNDMVSYIKSVVSADSQIDIDYTGSGDGCLIQTANGSNESFATGRTNKTTGLVYVRRNLVSASTAGPVVNLLQDNAGDDQDVLAIKNDGTGAGQYINQVGVLSGSNNNALKVSSPTAQTSRSVVSFDTNNASTSQPLLELFHAGTGPSVSFTQSQDVEVIDFDGCTDGGTGHTTVAGSIKVQMPNGSIGYINVYT